MAFGPTPTQRKNLTKLAKFLAALPADYKRFNMQTYMGKLKSDDENFWMPDNPQPLQSERLNECGACACAIGHGPAAPHSERLGRAGGAMITPAIPWRSIARPNRS